MIVFVFRHLICSRAGVLLLLLATASVCKGSGSYSQARCFANERQALLDFKQGLAVQHDDIKPLSSWTNGSQDCCSWDGIRCDNQTNHVIMLKFSMYGLGNEISPSLTQLKYLKSLDLSDNQFIRIPKFIGSFPKLRHLDLSINPWSGTIPSQLGNLTSLRFLDLGSYNDSITANKLQWLPHLSSLKTLSMTSVHFTSTSDWLRSIKMTPSLTSLEFSRCQFSNVDASSFSQKNSSNSITALLTGDINIIHPAVVPWFLNISFNLVHLDLGYNDLGGLLPDSFGNLNSLEILNLSENQFEGEIPKSLGTLCKLKYLSLSYNKLNGTLSDLLGSQFSCPMNSTEDSKSNRNQLEELYLSGNLFEGPLPNSLRQFPKLLVMSLKNNLLRGPLSSDLSPLSSLRELYAANNKLEGSLPESIGQLRNLEVLDASSNSFSGVISEAHLMNLSNLEKLDLSFSSLTFNLSSTWVPPFQLITLKLPSCNLGPRFPSWLRTQLVLSDLDISNSSVTDAIPYWFSNVSSKLEYLNLSSNHIHGVVPNFPLRSIQNPLSMSDDSVIVDLSSNQFHGALPLSLSNASELYLSNNMFTGFKRFLCTSKRRMMILLDLSDNLLSERIPDCWFSWTGMVVLNLENNNLYGNIPSSMGSLFNLQTLRLRNNNLSGNLPSSFNGSSGLVLLDVGHNKLKGKIPPWIGDSPRDFILLSLKSNGFYGRIPSKLCQLNSIQILDLSLNNLSGEIPLCIDNFTSMAHNKDDADKTITNIYSFHGGAARRYENAAMVMWKGLEYKYDRILGLLRVIDLSSNRLGGKIPKELASLGELVQVNLSRNHLSGTIPKKIKQMKRLESLDLSHNELSGNIPTEFDKLSSLAYLDLSDNRLWGKIPTSTQLQSFDADRYAGNLGLCGPPLTNTCFESERLPIPSNSSGDSGEYWFDMSWFYVGMGVGYTIGFWAVCGTLVFKPAARHAYFRSLNNLGDWFYVKISIQKAKLRRRLRK